MDESVQKHLKPGLDDASRLLLKVADTIDQRGWCQNDYQTPDGRVCILGAFLFVREKPEADSPIESAAITRLYHAIGRPHDWNDQRGRTKEEVVAKLRAVALGG